MVEKKDIKTLVRAMAPLLALLVLAVGAPLARAAEPTKVMVDTAADTEGGFCETHGVGTCSLREAVAYASSGEGGEAVRIEFEGLAGQTLVLDGEAITIDPAAGHSIAIVGPGTEQLTVSGEPVSGEGIFEVKGGAVTIAKLTLAGGNADLGGAIYEGGSAEELKLEELTVNANVATRGGAIYQDEGTLRISHSTIAENSSFEQGGGIYVDTASDKLLELDQVAIDRNEAQHEGGGIHLVEGGLKISGGEISENTALEDGGGLMMKSEADEQVIEGIWIHGNKGNEGGGIFIEEGEPTIRGTRVEENESSTRGGGIGSEDEFTLERSTVAENHSLNGEGGGIATLADATITDSTIAVNSGGGIDAIEGASVELAADTIARNTADSGEGRPAAAAGGLVGDFGITSSILYENEGGAGECQGVIVTHGHNVTGQLPSGCRWDLGQTAGEPEHVAGEGDQLGVDPELSGLTDHGGPAPTMGPLSRTSPIINHGSGPASTTDERNLPRPIPSSDPIFTDVGAFELQAPVLVTPPSISPNLNLREGDTLTCHAGGWDTETVEDAAIHFTWLVDGSVVAEGTPTYQLVAGDEEEPITCKVDVDDGAGSGEATTAAVEFEAGRPSLLDATTPFGEREVGVGSSAPRTLTLRNEGGGAIDVESVTSSGPEFPIEPGACLDGTALLPGTGCSIVARFAPIALGAQEAIVIAHTSAGTVTATLTGTGIEPVPKRKPKPEPEPEPKKQPTQTPAATPQPAPAPTPPAPAKLAVLSVSRVGNSLVLAVRCSAADGGCIGTATVSTSRAGTALAKGPLATRSGKATVKLALTAAGRRLLGADKTRSVFAHAAVHEPGSKAWTHVSASLQLGR